MIDPASLPQMSEDADVQAEAEQELARWGGYKLEGVPKMFRDLTDTMTPAAEVPFEAPAWIDHPEITDSGDYEAITKLALENRGLFIAGPWGTGKSYWARMFLEKHPRFMAVAPTHFAATNLDGMTIDALVGHNVAKHTFGRTGIARDLEGVDGIVVDEVSMIGEWRLQMIACLTAMKPGLIVIAMGDKEQLPPVKDEEFPYFEHPTWIEGVGGHRITLTKIYRSDARLNAIHKQMLEEGDAFKPDAHFDKNWQQCRRNLSWTNDVADHVNEYWMEKEKPESAVKVLSGGVIETIAWLYPGLPVVSKLTVKRKGADTKGMTLQQAYKAKQLVYNMQRGVVTSVDADQFTVHFSKEGRDLESPMNEFHSGYRVGYCSTTHKARPSMSTPLSGSGKRCCAGCSTPRCRGTPAPSTSTWARCRQDTRARHGRPPWRRFRPSLRATGRATWRRGGRCATSRRRSATACFRTLIPAATFARTIC